MSSAVRDLAEAEFLGERDEQNNPLPSRPLPKDQIEEASGNLMIFKYFRTIIYVYYVIVIFYSHVEFSNFKICTLSFCENL